MCHISLAEREIVQALRTARSATIEINGQRLTLGPDLTDTRPRVKGH